MKNKNNYLHFFSFSLFLILSLPVYSQTSYLKARLLQASTERRPEDWMIKNYHPEPKEFQDHYGYFFRTNFLMGGNKDLGDLYKDVQSKNESRILDRVDQSYGKPYDGIARIGIDFDISKKFHFGISSTAAEVMVLNNPVFPELDFFLYHDYQVFSSYDFYFIDEALRVTPKLAVGRRRVIDKVISTGDVLNKTYKPQLNEAPWDTLVEGSIESELMLEKVSFYYAYNNFVFGNQNYEYAEFVTGLRSYNFMESLSWKFPYLFQLYGYASIYRAGGYSIDDTVLLGTSIFLSPHLGFDIFTSGRWEIGGLVKLRVENFDVSVYTTSQTYDYYAYQVSRFYGANVRFQF